MPRQQIESTDVPGIRENSFIVREALSNGLYPDNRIPRNSPYAFTMDNLQAMPFGAVTQDEVEQPSTITNGIPVTDWTATGLPVLYKGERGRWLLESTQVSSADDTWTPTPVGATFTAGGVWQAVSFLEIPFFSNGSVFLWGTDAARTTAVTVGALGKHENRLLLGCMAGSVFSSAIFLRIMALWKATLEGDSLAYTAQTWDTGWIMYGERKGGSSDRPFDALLAMLGLYTTDNQNDLESYVLSELGKYNWGMCPLRYPGSVLAFHELYSGPVVFGAGGVCRLTPDRGIYRDVRVHPVGIGGRGCVGGSLAGCIFIDTNSELWKMGNEGLPQPLNLSPHLSNLNLAYTTIAFDPSERRYIIADKSYCYVLDSNDKLSGPFTAYSNAPIRDGNKLYGLINDRAEKVTNGAFASGTGWTTDTGWSIAGGVAVATAATGQLTQGLSVTVGESYIVRYRVTRSGGTVRVRIGSTAGTTRSATGTYSDTIVASGNGVLSFLPALNDDFTGTIDNVSVVPASLDVAFRTMPIDNGERGQKHLTTIQIGSEGITTRKAGADYRYDDSEASYSAGPYTDATPSGAVFPYPRIEYVDAKFVVTGKVARGTRGRLERVEVQYQRDDITFVRGTSGGGTNV